MRRLQFLTLLLLFAVSSFGNNKFTENFESGLPSSAPSSEPVVTLASGQWKIKGVCGKSDNGSLRLSMSGNGYAVTPTLCQPGQVTFSHRASGSGKKLKVEKSTDNGQSWQELGTATVSSSTPYGSSSFKCNSQEADTEVLIRFTCMSSTIYLDDITITLNSVSQEQPDIDDPTYITEGAWVPTKPFPTASKEIYLAPDGDPNGDGTFDRPWSDLQQAINAATPGTHIICRGGTYYPKKQSDGKYTVRIKNSGTEQAPIIIRAYEGEKPIFDFVNQLYDQMVGDRGLLITGNHWWLFGLHITHAADNGIKLEGSHNRIERCEFSYNLDTGLQLGFGHKFSDTFPGVSENDGSYCAYNDIIDCDSHHNCDYDANYGSDADGFACKMHNGKGNRFIRCRAWHNSDDGWDLFETDFDFEVKLDYRFSEAVGVGQGCRPSVGEGLHHEVGQHVVLRQRQWHQARWQWHGRLVKGRTLCLQLHSLRQQHQLVSKGLRLQQPQGRSCARGLSGLRQQLRLYVRERRL